MKLLATVILFIAFTGQCISQVRISPGTLHFSSFPPKDYLLDKGWRFQEGDNPDWARPDFGDSLWKQVSLSDFNGYLPALMRQHVGWFRIRLLIDSPGTMNEAVLAISQLGASDCYTNGKPFLHLGSIGKNGPVINDNPHGRPFLLSPGMTDSVTIAIRFATKGGMDGNALFRQTRTLPLSVSVSDWNTALRHYETDMGNERIPLGLSFLTIGVGILFMVIYIFYPDNRQNLVYSGFCFCLGMIAGLQYQLSQGNLDIGSHTMVYFLWLFTDRLCCVVILALLSLIVTDRVNIYQWLIIFWFLAVGSLFLYLAPAGKVAAVVLFVGRLLVIGDLLRLSYYAIRRGNFLPALTGLLTAALQASFIVLPLSHKDFTPYYYQFNQLLCFALLGLYLVRVFAVAREYQHAYQVQKK
jgi:hypothetical protein